MIDIFTPIYNWLKVSGTSLYTLVGDRIWDSYLPAGFDNTSACIVIQIADEDNPTDGNVHRVQIEFRCYGGSADITDARAVARALTDRMKVSILEDNNNTNIINSIKLSGQALPIDIDTGYPSYTLRYELNIIDT